MSPRRTPIVGLALVTALACEPEPISDGGGPAALGCQTCHGGDGSAAPPRSVRDETSTAAPGVGAHRAHLTDGAVRAAIACEECHRVPRAVDDEGHFDPLPAEVTWGPLATAHDQAPEWDRRTLRCAQVYCHGATLKGGRRTVPVWTLVDGTQSGCDACHGAPPPAPHPDADQCAACHPDTVRPDGRIRIAAGRHIDGVVDAPDTSDPARRCSACHGSNENAAPPRSVNGRAEVTDLAVGAHQRHVLPGPVSPGLACDVCHVVPERVDAPAHIDAAPAEVTFGGLAIAGGARPAWDRASASCSAVYCHGATLRGRSGRRPVWTRVSDEPAACDGCHGFPPAAPHPDLADCGGCHPGTLDDAGAIDHAGGRHLDGVVQLHDGCGDCHGEGDSPAPPRALDGAVDSTALGVGAHQKHLRDGEIRAAAPCEACHLVPRDLLDGGHLDAAPADLTWGPPATAGGLAPIWDRDAQTCAQTWCHGAGLAAGAVASPVWTAVREGPLGCDACHGNPPPPPHPPVDGCPSCHRETLRPDGTIDVAGGRHIDGRIDAPAALGCGACHGTADSPAPPPALDGSEDPSRPGVGAHRAHLDGGRVRRAVGCAACHVVPAALDDPGHLDPAPADLTFDALARTGGLIPRYDPATATCADVWCHGAGVAGGAHVQPIWTRVDGSQTGCGGCHGYPPPAPHPQWAGCHDCHPGTVDADGAIDLVAGRHIDGIVQAPAQICTACHGAGDQPAPPPALSGAVTPDDPGVGAHAAHLRDGRLRAAVGCAACHVVPETVEAAGHLDDERPAELVWSALATAGGLEPRWDRAAATCREVYCHGASLAGGQGTAPVWTQVDGSWTRCTSCHGFPPPPPHPPAADCRRCHPDTVAEDGGVDLAGGHHIDGTLDVADLACNACHGSDAGPAPPRSLSGAEDPSELGVGAHASHLRDGALRQAIRCEECHRVPAALEAPGHLDEAPAELTWGPLATAGGLEPVWDRDAGRCAQVWCHGAGVSGGTLTNPRWTRVDGSQVTCGTCHGAPPPAPHPQSDRCSACHGATVTRGGAIDVAAGAHINGELDF